MHNVKDTYQYQGIGRGQYCIRGISNKQNMRFCSFLSFLSSNPIPSHPIHISRNTSYVRPQERKSLPENRARKNHDQRTQARAPEPLTPRSAPMILRPSLINKRQIPSRLLERPEIRGALTERV